MLTMTEHAMIRHAYYVEGKSIRRIARELHIARQSVRKALDKAEPTPYTCTTPRTAPKLGPYRERIAELLATNATLPRKQRYTSHRIFTLIQAEGFTGSESTVRAYVSKQRQQQRRPATFLPLEFDPGQDAQVDWGEALATIHGVQQTVQVFVMTLCYSRRTFVMAFPSQRQEAFFAGHEAAFAFFGGVPRRISYDNLTTAVQAILQGRNRQEQQQFLHFRSHFLFDSHFCTPAQGHEKGRVEHRVGFSRRNYFVPIPEATSFADLNAQVLRACERDDVRVVQGTSQAIGDAWRQEHPLLRPLPDHPFDYAVTRQVRLTPYSQVCFETNHYSVPVDQAHAHLVLKAYPFHIVILAQQTELARHPRCYDRQQDILDPLHYLPLLQQRPGAFEHATPLRRWRDTWPPTYEQLLARLRERVPEGGGVREFIRILDLHRRYPADQVEEAIAFALEYGALNVASVTALLHQLQADIRPPRQTAEPPTALDAIGTQPLDLTCYDRLLERN